MSSSKAALLTALLALAGCGSAPPVSIYSLAPVVSQSTAPVKLPGVLRVQRLAADSVLNNRRIAWRSSPTALTVGHYPAYFWSLAPPEQLQVQMEQCLAGAKLADSVVTDSAAAQADWILSGRLRHFEQQLTGPANAPDNAQAQIEADLTLIRVPERGQVERRQPIRQLTLSSTVPLPSADPAAIADGMQRALQTFCDRLAQQLTAPR